MLRIALPKGPLLGETSEMLQRAGWGLDDYSKSARLYRLKADKFPGSQIKILQDKDIPIQVSVGNYDIGICSREWIEELISRYPSSSLVKLKPLDYGGRFLFAAVAPGSPFKTIKDLQQANTAIRIATEYPNIAQGFAASLRLRHFLIFPVWGGAEGYPPDDADVVIISASSRNEVVSRGLKPLQQVLFSQAMLVANRKSLMQKDLSSAISSVMSLGESNKTGKSVQNDASCDEPKVNINIPRDPGVVRLALPDGHQQSHVRKILDRAGIEIADYPSATGNRRPVSNIDGLAIKVIRPQDMPLQVANGRFDVAITGRDWLTDHLYRFPTSPLVELVDLKYGKVRIVAVVDGKLGIKDISALPSVMKDSNKPYRIATEYINIADRYAQEKRLGRYCIIPTFGATEAFIPEDADMLIENTETGGTIARHSLEIIDTLFISTACLIGRKDIENNPAKKTIVDKLVELLKKGLVEG
ncbi:MAG: ATP phosphoribosyltransferase [Dehalococcoidales bacterium]|nr:ATP phosphoribosyltransferase [Dehalococcoidales bacterium]